MDRSTLLRRLAPPELRPTKLPPTPYPLDLRVRNEKQRQGIVPTCPPKPWRSRKPWRRLAVVVGILLSVAVTTLTATPGVAHDNVAKPKSAERRELTVAVPDFTLVDQDKAIVGFASLRGKAVIVNFMYTSCPDICPLLTASVKAVQSQLTPRERDNVHFLSITTDPEIDTPAILKGYARRHGVDLSNWSFLTGKPQALQQVWRNFGVSVDKKGKGLIDHTTLTTVVDPQGRMRFAYFGSFPNPSMILEDLRSLALWNQ